MIDELLDTIVEEVATAPDFQGAAEKLTDWAQRLTGAEAAMLRYREGESEGEAWIPALVERGFGGSFLRDEVLVGEKECLCGRICRGRLDQSFPFVTPGGSFLWGKVQETAAEYPQDLPGGIRGRCISGAFDSVLIVPLVAEGTPIGCLHLADSAPGKFSDCVETIELACRVCAPGLLRFSSADRRESVIKAAETVLMPPELGQVRGFDLAVSYSSATKTAHLGGDFYDVVQLAEAEVLLVVGDYSGRGIGAAGMAARARHAIAVASRDCHSPGAVLQAAEARLKDVLPTGKFVTAVVCRLWSDGHLEVASAGHPYPLVLERDGGVFELVTPANPPLGYTDGRPMQSSSARFDKGQTLLLYTDGITESRRGSEFFGVEGIAEYWRQARTLPLDEVTTGIVRSSKAFHESALSGDDRLALAARAAEENAA